MSARHPRTLSPTSSSSDGGAMNLYMALTLTCYRSLCNIYQNCIVIDIVCDCSAAVQLLGGGFLFCFCFCFLLFVFSISLSLVENWGNLTWVRHSCCKSSATHSHQCVQYFCVSKQWYHCQCCGFLTCAQMMHAIAHRDCTDTVRVCT